MKLIDAREAVEAEIERLLEEVDASSCELAADDLSENCRDNYREDMARDARLAEALQTLLKHAPAPDEPPETGTQSSDIFSRPECCFNYCPSPNSCQQWCAYAPVKEDPDHD